MAKAPASRKNGPAAKTILVVEDDSDLSSLIEKKLVADGFMVVILQTGHAVLDYLDKNKPDLILLDVLLPDIDGITVLQQISTAKHSKAIPVIICSNLSEEGSFEQVKKIGDFEYIAKASTALDEIASRIKSKLHLT